MLVSKEAVLKWNSANRKRYVELGYKFTSWGDEFLVAIKHLTPTTRANLQYICDYCGKTCDTEFKKYNHNLKRSVTKKDSCMDCVHTKIKESSVAKYGVNSPNKADTVKKRKMEICLERYGVENVSCLQDVKNKVQQTVSQRYGVNNVFQSDHVIEKMKVTKYENKSITTSKQQLYLNDLLKGDLNFPVGKCSIDIALIKEKIAIEYDGGGHDLHIKFNDMTREEFNKKELKREYFLISNGWKILRIVSKNDYLPSDKDLMKYVSLAKEYLDGNRHWVRIDIDEKRIYGSKINENIHFENLRKIKDKDLKVIK